MRIIIAGAGEVGSHLARMLSHENHDIVLIDPDENKLKIIGSNVDLLTLEGSATSLNILTTAGAERCDLFIAVTQTEEINITASILAKRLGAKKTISRIDNFEYLAKENRDFFIGLGIDSMIYPEKMASKEIVSMLRQTGVTDLVDFSGGKLSLLAIKIDPESLLIDKSLADISSEIYKQDYKAVALTRDGKTIIPKGSDIFKVGDTIYAITNQAGIKSLMKTAGKESVEITNVMVLGGSRIGKLTAKDLGKGYNIKLIEINREKAYRLSNYLNNTLVINGDGTNIELLMQEGLKRMDAFIAVTGNSETNILSCLLAKSFGVKRTIAEIENMDYISLAEKMGVDAVINKKVITASRIFRHTMAGEVSVIKCLTGSDAEALEFIVQPDSKVTKGRIHEIDFPEDAIIGGIIRDKNSFIVNGATEIQANDHVVVFALPTALNEIGKYFS
ncbi:MAG TPA: Trk system potassium transporter TrkA [Bacteroidales bacterium]|nr:Trk system potassium transporter TrkA [Bacteroidales bacterium]